MAFSVKNSEADRLVREVMKITGENLTDAVVHSLQERLERVSGRREPLSVREELIRIAERVQSLPDLDTRSADEIIGYDENGLPS